MSQTYIVPLAISSIVVYSVYLMKKNETDASKVPNYPVIFISTLVIAGIIMYLVSSGETDQMTSLMQEIDIGDPPF